VDPSFIIINSKFKNDCCNTLSIDVLINFSALKTGMITEMRGIIESYSSCCINNVPL
jgi:hypothetical protein